MNEADFSSSEKTSLANVAILFPFSKTYKFFSYWRFSEIENSLNDRINIFVNGMNIL